MSTVRKRGKTWQIDYFDPHGKRIRKSFKTKKEATAELAKRVSLIAEGRYLDVKRECTTTFGELLDKYEENFKHQPSWQTCKKYMVVELRTYFGENTIIANIRYVDLETYRNTLMQKPTKHDTQRATASVNRAVALLRHIFTKAVEWEMIEQSPFNNGRSLVMKENNQRLRFLTEDEIPAVLDACPDYLRDIVECVLNTGMRKGEVLGLKWDQVRNDFIYLTKTKSNKDRQIPVNVAVETLLKKIRRDKHLTSPYVFTYQGEPVKDVKRSFASVIKKVGVTDFTFHDLRHTFASHFVMRGGSLKSLQELLGHASLTMTLRYAHLAESHQRQAVSLLDGLTTPTHSLPVSQNVTKALSK